MSDRRRYGWALTLALTLTSGAYAQDGLFGLFDGRRGRMNEDPTTDRELARVVEAAPVDLGLTVRDFDPTKDAPAMGNWVGEMQVRGAGHCYALSVLTAYFHAKVEFVPDETGLPWDEWGGDFDKVLRVDAKALKEIPHLLSRSRGRVEEQGKLKLGGFEGLREFTAVESVSRDLRRGFASLDGVELERAEQDITDQQATTQAFRNWAEAIQYSMQIGADGDNYLGSNLKSALGWVPGINLGPDAVNQDGVNIIRDRLEEQRLVPITLHPSGFKTEGHVVVVYQMLETPDEVILTTYDCNRPPSPGDAKATTVTIQKSGNWEYEAVKVDGGSYDSDWTLLSVPGVDGFTDRLIFERTAGNDQEHRERARHLGRVVSDDSSLGDRIRGGLGFVGEVLNPF